MKLDEVGFSALVNGHCTAAFLSIDYVNERSDPLDKLFVVLDFPCLRVDHGEGHYEVLVFLAAPDLFGILVSILRFEFAELDVVSGDQLLELLSGEEECHAHYEERATATALRPYFLLSLDIEDWQWLGKHVQTEEHLGDTRCCDRRFWMLLASNLIPRHSFQLSTAKFIITK